MRSRLSTFIAAACTAAFPAISMGADSTLVLVMGGEAYDGPPKFEVTFDGTTQNAGPGSVIFFASRAVTRLRNVGETPATYYVMYYYTPKTPKE